MPTLAEALDTAFSALGPLPSADAKATFLVALEAAGHIIMPLHVTPDMTRDMENRKVPNAGTWRQVAYHHLVEARPRL